VRQKELFKDEIIHQLELHPSRLDKEKIISEAMEEGLDDFFEGIRMAIDPLVTFGVKIVPEKENEKSQNFLWKDFRVLANKLIQRELTGHAARDAIITAMESAKKEEWNGFYRRVLIKDLRCGVSEKTINKIAKKFPKYAIPIFSCPLAHDSANHEKKMIGKKQIEIKLDVKVDLIENLGFEKIIYAKLSDNQIIIKSSEDINNQPLKISFSKDKVLFFDKNKNRIR